MNKFGAISKYLLATGLVGALYFLLGNFSQYYSEYRVATLIWPASGYAAAIAILYGRKHAVGLFLGVFALNYQFLHNLEIEGFSKSVFAFDGPRLWLAIVVSMGSVLQAYFSAYLIKKFVGHPLHIKGCLKCLQVFMLAGPFACLVAPIMGVFVMHQANVIQDGEIFEKFYTWWLGDAIGVIIFTPLILLSNISSFKMYWNDRMIGRFHAAVLCALLIPMMATFSVWKAANNFINEKNTESFLRIVEVNEHNFQDYLKSIPHESVNADILGNFPTSKNDYFELNVYTGTDDKGAQIYKSNKSDIKEHHSQYTFENNMKVFQKDWHFEWKSTPAFENSVGSIQPMFILMGGTVLTAFMVAFLMLFSRRSEAIQKIVEIKTEEIRIHQKELQMIFDHVPARIWYKDDKNNILRLNALAAKSMGGKVEDFEGKNTRNFFPDMADKYYADDMAAINSGQPIMGIIEQYTPIHGAKGWIETSKIPFVDTLADKKRLLVVSQDITERQIAEEALRKSEELNELVIRGLSAGVWDWDIENKKIYLSEKFRDILGWHKRGMAISFEEFIDSLHEDDREKCAEFINSHLTQKFPHDLECRILNGAGDYIWVHICGQANWDDAGKARRMVGSLADISERKQAEEELLRSNLELERFAYIASHDLQEPVRMIRNFSKLLTDEYGGILSGEAIEYLMFINRGAKNIQEMVEDLLEYSLAGQTNSVIERVELDTVIKNVMEVLRPTINESGAQVTYDPLPVVAGNPVNFLRLFQNIIGNGLKYRRADVAPEIHIMAEDLGDTWLFSISDNGIGIKEEYLERIFIIFKRLHNKSEYQGTGIGLAICKKIVDGLGGRIWAESQYGEGTDFYFTIPKDLSDKFVQGDL